MKHDANSHLDKSLAASTPAYPDINRAFIVLAYWANKAEYGWQKRLAVELSVAGSQVSRFVEKIKNMSVVLDDKTQLSLPGGLRELHLLDFHKVANALALNLSANATSSILSSRDFAELSRVCGRLGWDVPELGVEIFKIDASCVRVSPMVYEDWLKQWSEQNLHGHPGPVIVTASARHATSHALRMLAAFSTDSRKFLHVLPPRPRPGKGDCKVSEAAVLKALMRELDRDKTAENVTAVQVHEALKAAEVTAVIHNAHLVRPTGRSGMFALWNAAHDDTYRLRSDKATVRPEDRPCSIFHFPSGKGPLPYQIPKPLRGKGVCGKDISFSLSFDPPDMEPKIVGEVLDNMVDWLETETCTTVPPALSAKQSPSRTRFRRQIRRLSESGLSISRASLFFRAAALVDPRGLPEGDPTFNFRPRGDNKSRALEELDMLYTDILCLLHEMTETTKRALRLVSTTRHWLTRDMFNDLKETLGKHIGCIWGDVEDLVDEKLFDLATFDRSSGENDTTRVRTSLPVKSAIQDEWRRSDPQNYATVHLALAQILLRLADEKDQVAWSRHSIEYVYAAPGEGASSVFAIEAIRYAKRAFEALPECESAAHKIICRAYDFVEPVQTFAGDGSARRNHALSRRTGSYETILELLHMLSERNEAKVPSPLLPVTMRATYHEDIGIARFGSLDLHRAWEAFMRGAQDEDAHPKSQIKCLLHASSVATIAHSFEASEVCLRAVDGLRKARGFFDETSVHVAIRKGNLLREKGHTFDALEEMQIAITPEDLLPISGDRALAYIDTLIDAVDAGYDEFIEDISIICNANSRRLNQDGFNHEAALFEVRMARALCRNGQSHAAEGLLDTVGVSFLRINGSPRLHLEWCLASGEALSRQGHHEWAYAGYLEGGLHLALQSQHSSYTRQFARAATLALSGMQARVERRESETIRDHVARIERYLKREYGAMQVNPLLHGSLKKVVPLTLRASATVRSQHLQNTEHFSTKAEHPQHGYDLTRPFRKRRQAAANMAKHGFVRRIFDICSEHLPEAPDALSAEGGVTNSNDTNTFSVPSAVLGLAE